MAILTLTNADNGKTIQSRQGDEIILRLPDNPTTGYRWHIAHANGSLDQEGNSYQPDPTMQFGSAGVREFRFRAKAAGNARLELKHWREWEGESSVLERFALTIEISG